MPNESVSAMRGEGRDLRTRCGRLRDYSRDLRLRSEQCRVRVTLAAEGVGHAAASLCAGRDTNGADHLRRLVRAEGALQSAIAECAAALEEVRRELHGEDVGSSTVVH